MDKLHNTTMNNSSETQEELVQQINDELAQLFIPAIVFTCILMVTGLVGNSMVCYYYGFKAKRTPTCVFIVVLAVFDLIACGVTMPHEFVLSLQFYTYTDIYACKIVHLIGYSSVMASALTLPLIAVDRYRHICATTVYMATVKDAMKQCVIVAILALFLVWPVTILYDIEITSLPTEYGQDLHGSSCIRGEALSTYSFIFDGALLLLFSIDMAIIVILYFRIIKVLYAHRKQFGKSVTKTENPDSDKHSKRIDRVTVKVTIGMIVITALFFLSFLPRLSLLMWSSIRDERESDFLFGGDLLGFRIGRQSYMLNNSLNPWIYGIFNSQFRQFYYRKLCRRSEDMEVTTTSVQYIPPPNSSSGRAQVL